MAVRFRNSMLATSLIMFLTTSYASADQPLGYRGIDNSGIYPAEGLVKSWPEEGPPLAWKYEIGLGFSGVTVTEDDVFATGGEMMYLYQFSLDGQLKARYPMGGASWKRFSGTRSTPLVYDDIVVSTTPDATIYAFDLEEKKLAWKVNAWRDFGAGKGHMGWGYPESPMLHRDMVIFNACSRMDATPPLVAIDIKTGKKRWGMSADKDNKDYYSAGDASGACFNHNGKDFVAHPTWRYLVVCEADTGKKLWEIRKVGEKTLTPVYSDGYLLYDRGNSIQMLYLSSDGDDYEVLWERAWPGGFSHAVILDGRVYVLGNPHHKPFKPERINEPLKKTKNNDENCETDSKKGRVPKARGLLCLDAQTGKLIHWMKASGQGHIVSADGMVYFTEVIRQRGRRQKVLRISLIKPTEKGFEVTGRFVPNLTDAELSLKDIDWQGPVNPVIAEGKLFVRYGPLMAFELRASKMAEIRKAKAEIAAQVKQLQSDSAAERLGAVRAIAKAGPQARVAVDKLLELLKDSDRDVRKEAARTLAKIGPMALPGMIHALRDRRVQREGYVTEAILTVSKGSDNLSEALIAAAAASKAVREDVKAILPFHGKEAAQATLALTRRAGKRLRWWCIEVLKELGPDAAVASETLAEMTRNQDQWFRAHIAETLGRIGPAASDSVPALTALLDFHFADARKKAAIALGQIGVGSEQVIDALNKAAKDDNEQVVQAAKDALTKLEGSSSKE